MVGWQWHRPKMEAAWQVYTLMVRGFKKQKIETMTALCDVEKIESIKRWKYGPDFLRSTTCSARVLPPALGGKTVQRFPLALVCVLPGDKNETDGKRENYVTRNVNVPECAVVKRETKLYQHSRSSQHFEKLRNIYCINMRALQYCIQWNVSICEKCQREMARPLLLFISWHSQKYGNAKWSLLPAFTA